MMTVPTALLSKPVCLDPEWGMGRLGRTAA